ncbi:MAG: hypothetical protein V4644_00165 [Patescibacteria group bacterium]
MTTALLAVALLALGLPSVLESARMHAQASRIAASGLAHELARGPEGFGLIRSSSDMEDRYELSRIIATLGDGSAKQIESRASWYAHLFGTRSVSFAGIKTDYANATDYSCSPFLIGDWGKLVLREADGDSMLPPITAIATTRTSLIGVAASTAEISSPSLFIWNVSNDAQLELSLSFDSATSTDVGYIDVATGRGFIYALSAHSCPAPVRCASLDAFSITDTGLELIGSIPIPAAKSMTHRDGRLYVGLRAAAQDPEFLIFTLKQDGLLERIGSSEIGETVNDIVTDGSLAYIATSDNSIAGNRAIISLQVDSPSESMAHAARARQPGAGISQRLALAGNAVFLGRSSPLNSKELYILDSSDITRILAAKDTDSSIAGIVTRGFDAFILTRTRIERWRTEYPERPEKIGDSFVLPQGRSGSSLACSGNKLFLVANTASEGSLMTLSPL